jgi:hypothetical protein
LVSEQQGDLRPLVHARQQGLNTTPSSSGVLSMQAFMGTQGTLFRRGCSGDPLQPATPLALRFAGLRDCRPESIVAFETTRVLIAVYDGQDKDDAMGLIDGAVPVEVEG